MAHDKVVIPIFIRHGNNILKLDHQEYIPNEMRYQLRYVDVYNTEYNIQRYNKYSIIAYNEEEGKRIWALAMMKKGTE